MRVATPFLAPNSSHGIGQAIVGNFFEPGIKSTRIVAIDVTNIAKRLGQDLLQNVLHTKMSAHLSRYAWLDVPLQRPKCFMSSCSSATNSPPIAASNNPVS